MKKSFLTLFAALSLVASVNAQDQVEEQAVATSDVEAAEEGAKESINHWSIAVKGGINYLRQSDQTVDMEIGGLIERTFNPRWGMGIEYMFLNNDQESPKPLLDGYCHDITFFGSVNVSNIIAPYRSAGWQKLNLYANGGLGATIYGYELEGAEKETGAKLLFLGAANLEYDVCKWLGIFLEAQYRWHTNAEMDGFTAGRSFLSANLGLRLKFAGESNIRNIAWADYIPQVELPDYAPMLEAQKQECANMTSRLEDQINAQNEQIKKLQDKIKFTQDSLDRHIKMTKVPEKIAPTAEEEKIIKTALSNLEFESGKAVIKSSSFQYLDNLANMAKSRKDWVLHLKGYTDNTGDKAKNLQLSKDRAAAVKNYLVSKGVDPVNLESKGFGDENPIATNKTAAGRAKNRRVEIDLFSNK
ncbi:MAG: OmpA family protein [Paludibacteraceae bacterium]|nr:OmpA family protein [Paludibacteraceae bacterium]